MSKAKKRPSQNGTARDLYVREDWTLFRSVRTISQLSGVPLRRLRRLIAKELADNALDTGGTCRVGELPGGGFFVEDDGPGIPGSPQDIARLFSFRRPLMSSKVKRLPTRGALGNGLRVVAGAVFASKGKLRVITGGLSLDLTPLQSGDTRAKSKKCNLVTGTRIEVWLGDGIPEDNDSLAWAELAIKAAGKSPVYAGKTSAWFYDSDSFYELLLAAGARQVREVLPDFDGSDGQAEQIACHFRRRKADGISCEEADGLLTRMRSACEPVAPRRLTLLGKSLPGSYAKAFGTLELAPGRGNLSAKVPYTVEAYCKRAYNGRDSVAVLVNRTPVTGRVSIERDVEKHKVNIFGCNLGYSFQVGRKAVDLTINVQTPFMPITTNGKEPDLALFLDDLQETVEAAAKKCHRADRATESKVDGFLPTLRKGRPSDDDRDKYAADLDQFANRLKEIDSTLDFKVSSRGWCYILENDHGLSKGDFDRAQKIINDCRKTGLLPIDFTAEDDARAADHLEECDDADPVQHAASLVNTLNQWNDYLPLSFWDNQPVYIQMLVEKIDLKSLFSPVCEEYRVPLVNSRGWSDLNLRASMMRRFQEQELKGRRPVLLYCGDHDPVGLQIPDSLPGQFAELEQAVGWSPSNLTVERFGLNADFIELHNLTWIEGLQTSSGKDLGNPSHKMHDLGFVQNYIRKYGARKVEANALVVRPDAGRQLCREAIQKHLVLNAITSYEQRLAEHREKVRQALPDALQRKLDELSRGPHWERQQ